MVSGSLSTDTRIIFSRKTNLFCQLLNVHDKVRHTAVHTGEWVATGRSVFGAETAMEKLGRYKTPDKLPAELIQLVAETSHFEMCNILNYIWEW